MNVKQLAIYYSLFMGFSIILIWIYFISSGDYYNYLGVDIEFIAHIIAEFSTAVLLIVSAVLLIKKRSRAIYLLFLSIGMLIYTLILSLGYFIEIHIYSLAVMFATFALMSALILISLFIDLKEKK